MKLVTNKQALVEMSRDRQQGGLVTQLDPGAVGSARRCAGATEWCCRPPIWRYLSRRPSPGGWNSRVRSWYPRASPRRSRAACLSGDVVLEQRAGETQVEIRAGESLFDLHSLPAVDFPQLPAPAGEGFTVGQGCLS